MDRRQSSTLTYRFRHRGPSNNVCRTSYLSCFEKPIDTLTAAGVLMTEIWKDQRIVTVDMLGDEFLETVQTGDPITIHADGTVDVG